MKTNYIPSIQSLSNQATIIIPVVDEATTNDLSELFSQYKSSGWEDALHLAKARSSKHIVLYSEVKNISEIVVVIHKTIDLASVKKSYLEYAAQNKKNNPTSFVFDTRLLEKFTTLNTCCSYLTKSTLGLMLGSHVPHLYISSNPDKNAVLSIDFFTSLGFENNMESAIQEGFQRASTINSVIDVVNAPSNKKSPETLATWLKRSSEKHGYSCQVIEKEELVKQGFHALLAVNRGSEIPAKCLVAEYVPNKTIKPIKTIALVGKGITFDTGGVSIKGSQNMHYMKSDMGGAAAVMGTIELVAKLNLPVHLIAVIPTTDNSIGTMAIKPGDVISSYSGKTIEVIDTDAEGRLVLADGLAYVIKNYKPEIVLDLATLTGSVIRALGTEAAGIMTQNDSLFNALEESGKVTGEKLWRLPLWEEYKEYLVSDVADIRNLGSKPAAGAITAGKFLEAFTEDHPAWAHIDIAGTAFGPFPTTKGYGATGYGIELLTDWLSKLSK